MNDHPITFQHSYSFPETGESVTLYISDTRFGFHYGLSFNHNGEDIKWCSNFDSMCSIKSKVNNNIWYIYLTAYWEGPNTPAIEQVLLVKTCTAHHNQHHIKTDAELADKCNIDLQSGKFNFNKKKSK